jgi:predicted aminopeptidase
MMRWGDTDLIAVLFHELAHQVVYVKDDSAFNESFATAIEEIGVQLWLGSRGEQEKMVAYIHARELQQSLTALIVAAKKDLVVLYESDKEIDYKRVLKRERLKSLAEEIGTEYARNGIESARRLSGDLNNARLIPATLYEGRLPSFRALFLRCEKDLDCFYAQAKKLAGLTRADRDAALSAGDLPRFGGRLNEQ